MEWIEALKWPAVVLIVILIFKKQIMELILNGGDVSIGKYGLSARIGRPQTTVPMPDRKDTDSTLKKVENEYLSKDKAGEIIFDYSNNNGIYTIGENEYRFDTQWSKASKEYIHFYRDQSSIKSIRLAKDVSSLDKIKPEKYDSSSRARTAGINQIAIFENNHRKFLAVKILGLKDDSRGDDSDEIHFQYKILS